MNKPNEINIRKAEFPESVTEKFDLEKLPDSSRRKFLGLIGASTAFAVAGCTDYREKGKIVPYNQKPEEAIAGQAEYYATTINIDGIPYSALVKTREGRPIKIDGNPEDHVNQGKITAAGQASILSLYDPDRLKEPQGVKGGKIELFKSDEVRKSWEDIDKTVIESLKKADREGKEIAIVAHTNYSPTQARLFKEFKEKYKTAKVYTYDFFNDTPRQKVWEMCFGKKSFPLVRWHKAKTVVLLEADILGNEGIIPKNIRQIMQNRNVDNLDSFSRIYCFEAAMSLTGMAADYRIKITPEAHTELLKALINEVISKSGIKYEVYPSELKGYKLVKIAEKYGLPKKKLELLAGELIENKGKSIVYAGDKMPVSVHILTNFLNEILDSKDGFCVNHKAVRFSMPSSLEEMEALVKNMKNGKTEMVIHFDSNPVFHLPDDLGYTAALEEVPVKISLSVNPSETEELCNIKLPVNHDLESWGDFQIVSRLVYMRQPLIAPLFNTREKEAVLLNWMSGTPEEYSEFIYHDYLKKNWRENVFSQANTVFPFEAFWKASVHDGFAKAGGSGFQLCPYKTGEKEISDIISSEEKQNGFNIAALKEAKDITKKDFTLILSKNYFLGDGRYANNGWLQEIPHPVTKISWDNYALMSTITARKLGVWKDDIVEISINGRKIKMPVMNQPGMADGVIQIELGYGRWNAGAAGNDVGRNANVLLSKKGGISDFIFTGVSVKKTGEKYKLVTMQEHHALDYEFLKEKHLSRKIIREGTVEQYKHHPHFLHEKHHELKNYYPDRKYEEVKWAMVIDLNKCTACGNCVAACNVENNIPVVGKDQCGKGREMQWARIDRYYSGTPEDAVASNQPVYCYQCDLAPCENVCPVVATNHSTDGINQMVYNRCVGTRYCANNCPYKVRRFNFYDFRDHFKDGYFYEDSLKLLNNPEVTVRSRGVMEKCNFCLQRIMEARQEATKKGAKIKGSDVKTACQEACPSDAIIFGDMNDPESEVSKLMKHNLNYITLEYLNIKPNISYIARLRNTKAEDSE